MVEKFKAFRVEEQADGTFIRNVKELDFSELPDNDVLIKVQYSSLNYKDALSAIGNKGITKEYPHTPGIDAAGIIVEDGHRYSAGDEVIVTGFDLGMNTDGGFGEYIRVPKEWIIRLPKGFSLKEAMSYGTAGFTAALSVSKIVEGDIPKDQGPILVTGATGGVGIIAVSLLAHLGYEVTAVTGKEDRHQILKEMGANSVVGREEIAESEKVMMSAKWVSVVDTVGGNVLSTLIKYTKPRGIITTCGNVAGDSFSSSVYPFILRGVNLMGIDSAEQPVEVKKEIWAKLSGEWSVPNLEKIVEEVSLDELDRKVDEMLNGTHFGRTVLRHGN